MNNAAHEIDGRVIRRVVTWQMAGGALVAAAFFIGKGWAAAQAVLYGAIIGIIATLLLGRSVKRASRAADHPVASMQVLYWGAAQRFFFVLGGFVFGLAALDLQPLALLAGFVVAQAGNFINARVLTRDK